MVTGVGGSLFYNVGERETNVREGEKKEVESDSSHHSSKWQLLKPVVIEGATEPFGVWMHIKDYKLLSTNHVVIAGQVYPVIVNERGKKGGWIGVSRVAYHAIGLKAYKNHTSRLLVSSFHPLSQFNYNLSSIEFEISEYHYSAWKSLNHGTLISLNLHSLRQYLRQICEKQYLAVGRTIRCQCSGYPHPLFFTVKSMGYQKETTNVHYGLINEQTEISINAKEKSNIKLLEPVFSEHIEQVICNIRLLEEAEKSIWNEEGNIFLPRIVNLKSVVSAVEKIFNKKELVIGDVFKFTLGEVSIQGELQNVVTKPSFSSGRPDGFIYMINSPLPPIQIVSVGDIICVDEEREVEKNAARMVFEIVGMKLKERPLKNHKVWVDVDQLRQEVVKKSTFVRGEKLTFVRGGRVIVELDSGEFCLEMIGAEEVDKEDSLSEFFNRKSSPSKINLWSIAKSAEFVFKNHFEVISLVKENLEAIPSIREVVVSVRGKPSLKPTLVESFGLRIKLSDLNNLISQFPDVVQLHQKLSLTIGDDELICTIEEMELKKESEENLNQEIESKKESEENPSLYGILGKFNPHTKVKFFSQSGSSVKIVENIPDVGVKEYNLEKVLNEIGLGGFSKQFQFSLHRFVIPKISSLKTPQCGIVTPPGGILFYGPPGIGKTTLALSLPQIFGCKDCNVQKVFASDLLRVGELEKEFKLFFENARVDFEKNGKASSLHIIIFNQIDKFLIKTTENGQNSSSVIREFLISSAGFDIPKNIIVVGVTNRPEVLDLRALRAGPLKVHLEMQMPREKEREQILSIYLKPIKETNLLSKEVLLSTLAQKTCGFSGADIKELVEKAAGLALVRVFLLNLSKEERENHPKRIITVEDFDEALGEIATRKSAEMLKAFPSLYA